VRDLLINNSEPPPSESHFCVKDCVLVMIYLYGRATNCYLTYGH